MLRNGLRSSGPTPASSAASRASGDEPVVSEGVAGERSAEVGATAPHRGVESVRPFDVLLDEVLVVLRDRDVETTVRDDPSLVDRVLVRLGERNELVVLLGSRGTRGRPSRRTASSAISRARSSFSTRRRELAFPGHPVPAADLDVDRMHLAPADDRHDLVADLLQLECLPDEVRVVPRDLDRTLVAEEVRERGA